MDDKLQKVQIFSIRNERRTCRMFTIDARQWSMKGLKRAYDRVKRNYLWRTLSVHGVSSGLVQALQFLYRGFSVCVKINGADPDCCLYDLKEYECGMRTDEQSVKCFVYADDQVIIAPSACGLQEMVNTMNDYVEKRGMKVNVGKTKVMELERGRKHDRMRCTYRWSHVRGTERGGQMPHIPPTSSSATTVL
ncbi:hypothetical protein EVAR_52725_1 [Eumeta japonica]|uniref:Reverse transcriptase domain-containing protein n=1 Tax=Eumeta variegata TaxID=151549 RepID=A0A4C1ZHD6_EUMVA|nr:hypothetical protein EVAR_52725_1 [Eumeta japonica]